MSIIGLRNYGIGGKIMRKTLVAFTALVFTTGCGPNYYPNSVELKKDNNYKASVGWNNGGSNTEVAITNPRIATTAELDEGGKTATVRFSTGESVNVPVTKGSKIVTGLYLKDDGKTVVIQYNDGSEQEKKLGNYAQVALVNSGTTVVNNGTTTGNTTVVGNTYSLSQSITNSPFSSTSFEKNDSSGFVLKVNLNGSYSYSAKLMRSGASDQTASYNDNQFRLDVIATAPGYGSYTLELTKNGDSSPFYRTTINR